MPPIKRMTEEILEQAAASEAAIAEIPKPPRPWWHYGILLAVLLATALCIGLFIAGSREVPENTVTESTEEEISPFVKNPYGPNDFQFSGDYLTCLAGESVLGIDVSGFQGTIDWTQVADAGIRFVMIRVGGRGWGAAGTLYPDDAARDYYAGAKAAGLQVGAYFFSQATSTAEAEEEALYALSLIADWELDMPVVFDWEYISAEARTAQVDKRTLTDCVKTFCDTVTKSGKQAMLYTNPSHIEHFLYLEELTQYPLWLALHSTRMTYPYQVNMWQYTAQGSVPGISEAVDINLFFPYNN